MSVQIQDIILRKSISRILSLSFLVFFLSCSQSGGKNPNSIKLGAGKGQLKPVDINDSLYGDFRSDFNEIITGDGWKINYLVKDDSTKYTDIYIKWEKGTNVRTLNFPSILLMRSYFLPVFKAETDTHLFFEHGCATDCSAITVLPKNPEFDPHVFDHVINYDLDRGRIVFIPERSFSSDLLELDVFDLKLNQYKTVRFKNECNLASKNGCIEKVIFTDKTVDLIGTFRDEYGSVVTEKQTIAF